MTVTYCVMATGLDVAAGISGVISISFTLFRGCIYAFDLVSSAQNIGSEGDKVHCMLEWEQYRFIQWAERAGLQGSAEADKRLNWAMIAHILKQLDSLLTDANQLRERYNLCFMDIVNTRGEGSADHPLHRQGLWDRILTRTKPDLQYTRAQILKDFNGPVKKLRWAALDKDKIRRLIADISYFNDGLHHLLAAAEQIYVQTALSALLRDLVSRSTASAELEVIKALVDSKYISSPEAIASAATLKQIRLRLGVDKRPDEKYTTTNTEGPKIKLKKLKYSRLIRQTNAASELTRELVTYDSKQLLVEWKPVRKELEAQVKRSIESLALLLSNIPDPSFHSLNCVGYLQHESSSHYAFVFDLPSLDLQQEQQQQPEQQHQQHQQTMTSVLKINSLLTLFHHKRIPSLSHRVSLALALAETVLQLHTSGWLHKGIRSENVLFLDIDQCNWEQSTALGPYVAGYEYARAGTAVELSELPPSSPEIDLYRHPRAQGEARPSFQKAFDIYALGCVLLEIALWTGLRDVLLQAANEGEAQAESGPVAEGKRPDHKPGEKEHLMWTGIIAEKERLIDTQRTTRIFDQVAFCAGETYREVVKRCLMAGHDVDEDDDIEASVEAEIGIVKLLSEIKC